MLLSLSCVFFCCRCCLDVRKRFWSAFVCVVMTSGQTQLGPSSSKLGSGACPGLNLAPGQALGQALGQAAKLVPAAWF